MGVNIVLKFQNPLQVKAENSVSSDTFFFYSFFNESAWKVTTLAYDIIVNTSAKCDIVLKFQNPLQVIMVFMPIGNSKWSTAKVKIALKTYELHFRNLIENHWEK
jgi:hypothetical protein